jgi:hypothetical protein
LYDPHQKFETDLRQKAVEKMMELRERAENERSANVDYIFDATEQLIECRRTLKHTYVLAFYLPDASPEKNLFEWLQEELEVTTEALSGVLEKPLTGASAEKRKITDLTNLARTRLEHLLEGVRDGTVQEFATAYALLLCGGHQLLINPWWLLVALRRSHAGRSVHA